MFDWTVVLLFTCIGIFYVLSSLVSLLAWIVFGPIVAQYVFWISMGFGVCWTASGRRDDQD